MTVPLVLVHGGAGAYAEGRLPEARAGCDRAAKAGAAVLAAGGSARDAVCEAVRVLEDDPEFNAGTGSCLNREGEVEMDACLMVGEDLRAGAVAALRGIRNPILAARLVLERSPHVLLSAEGARRFLLEQGVLPYPPAALVTPRALLRWQGRGTQPKHGTVGAVALDAQGHLAAATSTGGLFDKLPGRIGDSPIPGAGTFADDARAAASATGEGEPILRFGLTRTAADLALNCGSAQEAVDRALEQLRARTGAEAGLILLTPSGDRGISRTTPHLSWAWRDVLGQGDAQAG